MSKMKAQDTRNSDLSSTRSEDENQFVSRMRLCAEKAGSVNALARKAGLSQSTVRRYFESGEPSRPHLVKLAAAANVSVAWLASGEGEPDKARPSGKAVGGTGEEVADLDLLERVSRSAFEELQRRNIQLEPAALARLVRVLYRHFASRQEMPDHATVSNIIDLAAYR